MPRPTRRCSRPRPRSRPQGRARGTSTASPGLLGGNAEGFISDYRSREQEPIPSLPILPVIPHADRAFGLFAEAEELLHDPLNRLAHLLVRPLAVVLFLFGLTRGGIDLQAFAPTTLTVLAFGSN